MRLTFVRPWPELRSYIESLWVFESDAGFPATDTSIAAPNGCSKLIIPYKNSLWSRHPGGRSEETKEHGLYFVGVQEAPTVLTSSPRETGFIAIEFRPEGAYPFLRLFMAETANGLFSFEELRTRIGREMRETVCNLEEVDRKIQFVQARLADLLRDAPRSSRGGRLRGRDAQATGGLTPIKALEQQTGYSAVTWSFYSKSAWACPRKRWRGSSGSSGSMRNGPGDELRRAEEKGVRLLSRPVSLHEGVQEVYGLPASPVCE